MFNILHHLPLLTDLVEYNTYYQANCPVCYKHKLKINKTTGAYACYSNFCDSRDIRVAMGLESYSYRYRPRSIKDEDLEYDPVELSLSVPSKPLVVRDIVERKESTFYNYGDNLYLQKKRTSEGKEFYPVVFSKQQFKVTDVSNFILYSPATLWTEGNVFFTEGESCAYFLTCRGYTSFSIAFHLQSNYEGIKTALKSKLTLLQLLGVIYLPDNDKVGKIKANKFEKACNSLKIPNKVVDPHDLCPTLVNEVGQDIVNLYRERLIEDVIYRTWT